MQGQSIGASRPIHIVCRLSAAAAGHIFRQKIWLPRDVLLEIRQESLQPHVSRSSRFLATNDGDGFSLIERDLGKNPTGLEQEITEPNVSGNLSCDSELTFSCFHPDPSSPQHGFGKKHGRGLDHWVLAKRCISAFLSLENRNELRSLSNVLGAYHLRL